MNFESRRNPYSRNRDAAEGVVMVKYLAMIAAWIGDNDQACERLGIAINPPNNLSYGQLKLMPYWDPLRAIRALRKSFSRSRRNSSENFSDKVGHDDGEFLRNRNCG